MSESGEEPDDWADRLAALESVFGASDDTVIHAIVPFQFGYDAGGRADVVPFRKHVPGYVYVTCDLLGCNEQVQNSLGTYELAVCHRVDEPWGADVISKLSYYTLDAKIEPGQTMDLGPAVPDGSSISAFLFDAFAHFSFRATNAGVLLCIGITPDELAACRRGQVERVRRALRSKRVYPFTDLNRRSVLRWF